MKVSLRGMLLLLLCVSSFRMPVIGTTEEYNIKAAFLYKFTNYIDWGYQAPGDQFIIGVMGSSPIVPALEEIARTKTVNGRKIVVRQYANPEDMQHCQILFVSQASQIPLSSILLGTSEKGTLVVSEKPGYCAMGTGINFVVIENKLKFEANPKVIYSAGLTASSQLLKLAIIVN